MCHNLSIVICTKDRQESLIRCLSSIFSQSYLPFEIIIVDDGQLNKDLIYNLIDKHGINFKYLKKEQPGVALSRNYSIDYIEGDTVLFLDDDVILDPEYITGIMDVYQTDHENEIFGVTGVVRVTYRAGILPFLRFFCLDGKKPGTILPSGNGVLVRYGDINRPIEVKWLPGFNMSYRKEVLYKYRFDPQYTGNGWGGEDRDFSFRLSKSHKLVATPKASLIHCKDPSGRSHNRRFGYMETHHFFYFFKKNMPKDIFHYLAVSWAITGILIKNIFRLIQKHNYKMMSQISGNIQGIYHILLSKVCEK